MNAWPAEHWDSEHDMDRPRLQTSFPLTLMLWEGEVRNSTQPPALVCRGSLGTDAPELVNLGGQWESPSPHEEKMQDSDSRPCVAGAWFLGEHSERRGAQGNTEQPHFSIHTCWPVYEVQRAHRFICFNNSR